MAKFCDKCGSELKNENSKFCDKCGAGIIQNEPKNNEPYPTILCQKCGTANHTTATQCINCGYTFNNEIVKFIIILGYICGIIEIFLVGTNWFFIPLAGILIAVYLLVKCNLNNYIHPIIIYLLSTFSLFFLNWLGYIPPVALFILIIIMILILVILIIYTRKSS